MDNTIKVTPIIHRGEKRLRLDYTYDTGVNNKVRQIPGRKWSKSLRCWHVPVGTTIENYFEKTLFFPDKKQGQETNEEPPVKSLANIFIDKKEGILYLQFPYDETVVNSVRRLEGQWWHQNAKTWSVFDTKNNRQCINNIFKQANYQIVVKDKNYINEERLRFKQKATRENLPQTYLQQLILENKSKRTIEIYVSFVAQFLYYFKEVEVETLETAKIRDYVLVHRERMNYSESYQNQMVSALKSYYWIMHKRKFETGEMPRPKNGRVLPKVLPKEDVQKIFNTCLNQKHRIILLLLYGFGMRVGEVTALQMHHIDFDNNRLYIIKGKGRKDRTLPIPVGIKAEILKYIERYLPYRYFIEGFNNAPYTTSSIQKMVKETSKKAGINKVVTPHILRHCYATHMLEKGIDLRYIQRLLGHKSSKTTEIYTHVSMEKLSTLSNPMEDINF